MHLLEKAILIATTAHADKLDKGNQPYILHPLAVMAKMTTLKAKIVAVLHDVKEDSKVTFYYLRQQGFDDEIIVALDCLTRRKDESYTTYINRVMTNKLAIQVKLADLEENMDLTRLSVITNEDLARWKKYKKHYTRLQKALKSYQ